MRLLTFLLAGMLCAPPVQAASAVTTVATADGHTVAMRVDGKGDQGVVLVHGQGRDMTDWADLAPRLLAAGLVVATVDLRGHGATGGEVPDDGGPAMVADVAAAVAQVRARGAQRVSVVGFDLGGLLAMQTAADDTDIHSVVLLSPRLSSKGVKVSGALAGLGERPALLVTGSSDVTGMRAAGAIAGKLGDHARLEVIDGGTEGLALFKQAATLEGLLVTWLSATEDGMPGQRADAPRASSDTTAIETTGTRIGEGR